MGESSGYPAPVRTPDLTVLTEGAKKCADTTTVDSSQRSHEAAQEQVHRETRRLRNSLDGGGRHDVGTHHGVRQLIPQRGPTIRSGPSPRQPPAPHPRPGSPPGARRPAAGPTAFDSSPFPTCAATDARGIPLRNHPAGPTALPGAGRCRRSVPSPAAALGLRWSDLEPGRTRTDDHRLQDHQSPHPTTSTCDTTCDNSSPRRADAVGNPVRRQFCHKPCHKRSSCSALALSCAAHRAGVSGSVVACVVIPSSTRWRPQRYCGVEM